MSSDKIVITKNLLFFILLLTLLPMLSAAEESFIFERERPIDLDHPCVDSLEAPCDSSILCNITILYPNGTRLIDNGPMTARGAGFYNFTITSSQTGNSGEYSSSIQCIGSSENGISTFNFLITPTGTELSTGQGILFVILLALAVLVFALTLTGAIILPFKNVRDDQGINVVKINDLKYVKILLWFASYVMAIWIMALSTSLMSNFLNFPVAVDIFYVIYWFLLSFFWPVFVVFLLFAVIAFIEDSNVT